jgi:hypothetical protein
MRRLEPIQTALRQQLCCVTRSSETPASLPISGERRPGFVRGGVGLMNAALRSPCNPCSAPEIPCSPSKKSLFRLSRDFGFNSLKT